MVTQTYRGKADLLTSGSPFKITEETQTSPGTVIDLIDYTVPTGKKIVALQVFISCRLESKIRILKDGSMIGVGRTGPGEINSTFGFEPYEEINEGENLKITCEAMSWRPSTDIEAVVQGRELTIQGGM
jgi:hypothetical protein